MKFKILIPCILLGLKLTAQEAVDYTKWKKSESKAFEYGIELYEDKSYALAYDVFHELLNSHPEEIGLKYLTGICAIYRSDKHIEAQNLLNEVYRKNKKAANIDYHYAHLYHRMGQFEKSLSYIDRFNSSQRPTPEQSRVLKKLKTYCLNGLELIQHPVDVHITNLGSPPNSQNAEYSPVVTADESRMIYTYRGTESTGGTQNAYGKPSKYGYYYEDIFISDKVDGKWQRGKPIDAINSASHDAAIGLSSDGQQLLIFKSTDEGSGDIYVSKLNGTEWQKPEKLKGIVNSSSWEGSASFSASQKILYFSSERPGGYGGRDLYRATLLDNGEWGRVVNMGPDINTPDDEDAPYIHPDGLTLVFSSNGHNSIGGFDIFQTDFNEVDSVWSKPRNIGYPINTPDDEIYYVLSADGKRGYFASGKQGGSGDKDIYLVEPAITAKRTQLTMLRGTVRENGKPTGSEIKIYFKDKNKNYGVFSSNSVSGGYLVNLPAGYVYKVSFRHPKLGYQEFDVDTKNANSFTDFLLDVNFTPIPEPEHKAIVITPKEEPELSQSFKNYEPDTVAASSPVTDNTPAADRTPPKADSSTTAVKIQPVPTEGIANDSDSLRTVPTASVNAASTASPQRLATETTTTSTTKETKPISENLIDKATADRLAMMEAYGDLRIEGLTYVIQVAAYRHPENYKYKHLENVVPIRQKGEKLGDISLFESSRSFDTWREADALLRRVKEAGQTDAFLTVMYHQQRLYLKDLISRGIWKEKVQVP